jgi:hypothetical protein
VQVATLLLAARDVVVSQMDVSIFNHPVFVTNFTAVPLSVSHDAS